MSQPIGTVGGYVVSTRPDPTDLRDQIYRPTLLELPVAYRPAQGPGRVRDQVLDGPCTGYALAAVIDMQNQVRSAAALRSGAGAAAARFPDQVSARMLYEMARSHDEFPDSAPGSSLRGVVKGFYHHGVCPDDPVTDGPLATGWVLPIERAKAARSIGLGAYYRIEPLLNHYHAAISEVGAILVSAAMHDGWGRPGPVEPADKAPASPDDWEIPWQPGLAARGGHAFAVVGYDETGFLVLNSWGPGWSRFGNMPGMARWTYEDWAANVMDAWVLRLGAPTPRAFDLTVGQQGLGQRRQQSSTRRIGGTVANREVIGHYINVDDGLLVRKGSYPSTPESLAVTAQYLGSAAARQKYDHLLFYAHGGLNSQADAIGQVAAMKEAWKRNRIYPVHFVWNTGLVGESADIVASLFRRGQEQVGSGGLADGADFVFERTSAAIGRALWREMKNGALRAFQTGRVPGEALAPSLMLARAARSSGMGVHVACHSVGSILLGYLSARLARADTGPPDTVSLMAPACTVDFARTWYGPVSDRVTNYILSDVLEQGDTVGPYGKSLLYLVSRAFEDGRQATPLLGMELHAGGTRQLEALPRSRLFISYGPTGPGPAHARTHGDFDDDTGTLNSIIATITGSQPAPGQGF
jgi:hypothetical protein